MMGSMRAHAWLLAILLTSCGGASYDLLVDLRTDFLPGAEVAVVETEVVGEDGAAGRQARYEVTGDEPFLEGARVAELSELEAGSYRLEVRLFAADERLLGIGRLIVSLEADTVSSLLVQRSCPQGEDCALCETVDDCSLAASCVSRTCDEGACLLVPDSLMCDAGFVCDLQRGCTPLEEPTGCVPSATFDECGADDEDCDGIVDEDCSCDGSAWALSPVDGERDADPGEGIDFVVTAAGSLHAAYYARDELRYAFHANGAVWTSEIVPDLPEPRDYPMSAAVDGAGTLHVLYRGSNEGLVHAQRLRDGTWGQQTLGEGDARFPSLAVDSDGGLHASYYGPNRSIYYVYRPALGGWGTPVPLDAESPDHGESSAIALGPGDVPHVAYLDRRAEEIRVASLGPDDAWTSEPVEQGNALGDRVAMQVGADGTIHVAYFSRSPRGVHYAQRSPTDPTYAIERIAEDTDPRDALALAVTPDGLAHVVYHQRGNASVHIASATTGFVPRQVAPTGTGNPAVAVTADPTGALQIAYHESEARDLMRAEVRPDGTITRSPLITRNNRGELAAIACDDRGLCHAVGRGDRGSKLDHAMGRADAQWRSEVVDAAIRDGQDPSLAVPDDGTVWIAYRLPDRNLGLAHRAPGEAWTLERPQTTPEPVDEPTLIVSPSGDVRAIAYRAGAELKWLEQTGATWAETSLDMNGQAPSGFWFGGDLYLAYLVGGELRLRVREAGSPDFLPAEVVIGGDAGSPDLRVVEGVPLIGYRDTRARTARVAYRAGGAWTSDLVDDADDCGVHISLRSSGGAVFAAHYDSTLIRNTDGTVRRADQDLRFASRLPAEPDFTRTLVDGDGNVGRFAGLGLDDRGRLFIAYYQSTGDGQLRLARRCR